MGTTGRILLIAALAFGGLYYYETSQIERQKQEFYNQLERDRIAREDAKQEREEREEKARQERERQEVARQDELWERKVAADYLRCFGRPVPLPWRAMDNKQQIDLLMVLYPGSLSDERPVCDRPPAPKSTTTR